MRGYPKLIEEAFNRSLCRTHFVRFFATSIRNITARVIFMLWMTSKYMKGVFGTRLCDTVFSSSKKQKIILLFVILYYIYFFSCKLPTGESISIREQTYTHKRMF